jgi:hypothetical protein
VGDLVGGLAALEAGVADAFMWEKTMSLPFVIDGQFRRVAEFAGPWPAFVVAASAAAVEHASQLLPQLLDAVAMECRRARERLQRTAETIQNDYRIPPRAVLDWLQETRWDCRPTVSASMLDNVSQILTSAGILESALPAHALIGGSTELLP